MNKVILMGRLTDHPEIRYTQGEEQLAVARYRLAVNRNGNEKGADFINCVAFGRSAQFAERYLAKGMQILITGRIQTGSYTNREGVKIYTTDIIIDTQEFTEKKEETKPEEAKKESGSEFMEDLSDDQLPFN